MNGNDAVMLAFLTLLLATSVYGYSEFQPECTIPVETVNYVSSSNSRGTLDILWGCLFTIIICTWTIQHLNVPEQRNGRDQGTLGDIKWHLKGVWTTTKWMLFTIIAPEYTLGKALADLYAAWLSRTDMAYYAKLDGVEWGLAHGFYANMGGFMAIPSEEKQLQDMNMGGIADTNANGDAEAGNGPNQQAPVDSAATESSPTPRALLAHMIYDLRKQNDIPRLPDITSAEISDKSKGSVFIKAVTLGQVAWVIVQIIGRVSQHRAISQLELAVAAFSICAVVTYILLLYKPQGIEIPSRPISCASRALSNVFHNSYFDRLRSIAFPLIMIPETLDTSAIPNDVIEDFGDAHIPFVFLLGTTIGGMIFGSVHVAGWNLDFPTPIESLLWRISSIIMLAGLPILFLTHLIMSSLSDSDFDDPNWIDRMASYWVQAVGVLYFIARLYTLVEAFRTLLFLPPDAYVATWANNVPHFG